MTTHPIAPQSRSVDYPPRPTSALSEIRLPDPTATRRIPFRLPTPSQRVSSRLRTDFPTQPGTPQPSSRHPDSPYLRTTAHLGPALGDYPALPPPFLPWPLLPHPSRPDFPALSERPRLGPSHTDAPCLPRIVRACPSPAFPLRLPSPRTPHGTSPQADFPTPLLPRPAFPDLHDHPTQLRRWPSPSDFPNQSGTPAARPTLTFLSVTCRPYPALSDYPRLFVPLHPCSTHLRATTLPPSAPPSPARLMATSQPRPAKSCLSPTRTDIPALPAPTRHRPAQPDYPCLVQPDAHPCHPYPTSQANASAPRANTASPRSDFPTLALPSPDPARPTTPGPAPLSGPPRRHRRQPSRSDFPRRPVASHLLPRRLDSPDHVSSNTYRPTPHRPDNPTPGPSINDQKGLLS